MANENFTFPDEKENIVDVGDDDAAGKAKAPEIEIEVVDDTPPEDKGRKPLEEPVEDPTEEEVAQYSAKVRQRMDKLTHARHDERRAKEALQKERDELERYALAVTKERDSFKAQASKGAEVATNQAGTLADKDIAEAKAKLKAAHESFDTDAIVDAQAELNEAQMRKAEVVKYKAQAPLQEQKTVVNSRQSAPTAPKLDEKTATWMAKNKWFGEGGDKSLTGFALGLHQDLVEKYGDSYTRTDEYFSTLDKAMRQTFPENAHFKGTQNKRPSSIVASASRDSGAGPRKVTLTQQQVALAKKFGLTPQQYAAEIVKLGED